MRGKGEEKGVRERGEGERRAERERERGAMKREDALQRCLMSLAEGDPHAFFDIGMATFASLSLDDIKSLASLAFSKDLQLHSGFQQECMLRSVYLQRCTLAEQRSIYDHRMWPR